MTAIGTVVEKPTEIELAQVRRFFRRLKDNAFITLVFDGEDIHLYAKGVTEEELRSIEAALNVQDEREQ